MSLYEDRTQENLLKEALEKLNDYNESAPEVERVDGSEGSLAYFALSRQAGWLEDAYDELDNLNDNMLVDTQDLDHLIESGKECGVPIIEGTAAVVLGDINCECEVGTEFSAVDSDYDYIVTGLQTSYMNEDDEMRYVYFMESEEEGVEQGNYRGAIEPIDYLQNFEDGAITGTYTVGTEQEDEEVYRERRIESFQSKACAGNKAYYMQTVGVIEGVGGVKTKRREQGETTVNIWIQDASYGVPSQTLVNLVKEIMDPTEAEGEGIGKCPYNQILVVNPAVAKTINITSNFTYAEGYDFAGLESALRAAADTYLLNQRKNWQDEDCTVRISGLEAAFLTVTGIVDVAGTALNGTEANIYCDPTELPILGTLAEA